VIGRDNFTFFTRILSFDPPRYEPVLTPKQEVPACLFLIRTLMKENRVAGSGLAPSP
jgi:hypothetical protein